MKFPTKTAIALSFAAIAPAFFLAAPATAQVQRATGLQGSYIGGSAGLGLDIEDGFNGVSISGLGQGRYDVQSLPVSIRGSVLFNDQAVALQPVVTYDLATGNQANIYVGGGASVLLGDGESPLGDKTAFLLTAGFEREVNTNWAVFSDVRWGINAFEDSDRRAISLQTGAAYRF